MRVKVHTLDFRRKRMLLQRVEQGRGKTTPPILGQHEQTDNLYDLARGVGRGGDRQIQRR
jgi:hypothetical protein